MSNNMIFKIKVIDKSGKEIERTEEAPDKFAIFNTIRERGEKLVSVEEKGSGFKFNFAAIDKWISTVKNQDKIIFARNLGAMIEAGLPTSRALSVMERQTKNKKFNFVLGDLEEKIREGQSLSEAMKNHSDVFSKLFTSMVKAGEESGTLTESLRVVSDQMEKTQQLKKKVRGALMYPAIILTIMTVIGALMMIYVVPTMTSTFNELGVDLPASTRLIIFISQILTQYTLWFIAFLIALGVGLYLTAKSKKGKSFFNWFFLRVPIISGLIKETNSARTTRTLSSLLSSGVEVISALEITEDVLQNVYYKEVMVEARTKVQKGVSLSDIFSKHEDIYPIFVGEMISVGEETGKLSEMLERVAVYYENEVSEKTKNLSTIIEPLLMVVIGAAVGFFALAMISPTYSLVDGL